jgi:hypothetical protein
MEGKNTISENRGLGLAPIQIWYFMISGGETVYNSFVFLNPFRITKSVNSMNAVVTMSLADNGCDLLSVSRIPAREKVYYTQSTYYIM